MPELERQLRELGNALELPAAPDLVDVVRARIAEEREPRRRVRRSLVLAIAVLGLALAAAMAVPQARTAILEFLHIRGASVEKVPTLPSISGSGLDLGEPVSLDEAREAVSFEVAQPELPGLGRPDSIYVDRATPGGQVFFLWGTEARAQVLLSEFRGDLNPELIGKQAGPETTIEPVNVQGGAPGFWVAGANHVIYYLDRDGEIQEETIRLSRNALLWERNDLTLRLEGGFGKDRALELARTVP
ncbi:MAG TPA: hypothetical protein VNB88_01920 [Gaiellaceae bacterium]|nr:hypothetical protein [Gaiellaceae bacterium]